MQAEETRNTEVAMFGAPADAEQTGTAVGHPDSVTVAVEDFVVQLLLRRGSHHESARC